VHRNDGEAVTEGGFVMIPMGLCVILFLCILCEAIIFVLLFYTGECGGSLGFKDLGFSGTFCFHSGLGLVYEIWCFSRWTVYALSLFSLRVCFIETSFIAGLFVFVSVFGFSVCAGKIISSGFCLLAFGFVF